MRSNSITDLSPSLISTLIGIYKHEATDIINSEHGISISPDNQINISISCSGGWFNKKNMSFCQYRKSHWGDKTVVRSSYLNNGISYTGKMTCLYWIRALALHLRRSSSAMILTMKYVCKLLSSFRESLPSDCWEWIWKANAWWCFAIKWFVS